MRDAKNADRAKKYFRHARFYHTIILWELVKGTGSTELVCSHFKLNEGQVQSIIAKAVPFS